MRRPAAAAVAPVTRSPFLPSRALPSRDRRRYRARGRRPRAPVPERLPLGGLLAACVVLAALSLLGPAAPTYDPWAWIIWGREITEGNLVTTYGPSWKPLPVLLTTPFALLGDGVAPALWVLVARAGGLLSIAMAGRLASRIAGWPAGLIAAGGLLLCDEYIRHFARGNSEGILVALCLWAIDRHMDGRHGSAFALGFAAALLRPEVWPFFGLYGAWLLWREPQHRALVIAAFAATPLLWFLPEYLGSGDFLRAAERARQANPDSPAHAARPALEVFKRASGLLPVPVLIGGVVAVVLAIRAGRRRGEAGTVIALAVIATALMLGVAAMTELGFAGNLRYVALPAAMVCVLAGIGFAWLVASVAERRGERAAIGVVAVLALASLPIAASYAGSLGSSLGLVAREAAASDDIDRAIAAAGGAAAVDACGGVYTAPYDVQVLAYKLHRHGRDVGLDPRAPGTIFAPRTSPLAATPGFVRAADTDAWAVAQACRR